MCAAATLFMNGTLAKGPTYDDFTVSMTAAVFWWTDTYWKSFVDQSIMHKHVGHAKESNSQSKTKKQSADDARSSHSNVAEKESGKRIGDRIDVVCLAISLFSLGEAEWVHTSKGPVRGSWCDLCSAHPDGSSCHHTRCAHRAYISILICPFNWIRRGQCVKGSYCSSGNQSKCSSELHPRKGASLWFCDEESECRRECGESEEKKRGSPCNELIGLLSTASTTEHEICVPNSGTSHASAS